MALNRRITTPAISRLLATSGICGLVSCGGSSSAPPTTSVPVSIPVSVTVTVVDTLPRPVADARVEITTGIDAGKFTTTAADGHATISGRTASGSLSLRFIKPGMSLLELSMQAQDSPAFVTLIPDVLLDLAGEHQLTVEADPLCELPEVARSRTYQATFTTAPNNPAYLYIQLGGASFFRDFSRFATYVNASAARFEIYRPGYEEEDPMVEQVSPTEYVAFTGEAIADANQGDSVIAARFFGSIEYCPATPTTMPYQCPVQFVMCRSETHRLILTRR